MPLLCAQGGDAGCVIVKSAKAIIIAVYEGGLQAGNCVNVVRVLGVRSLCLRKGLACSRPRLVPARRRWRSWLTTSSPLGTRVEPLFTPAQHKKRVTLRQ